MLENDWETTKELEDDRCQEGEEINKVGLLQCDNH